MRMNELDIWRCANVLFKEYGTRAVFVASKRADSLFNQGDVERGKIWLRIARAIAELERKRVGKNEVVH